MSAHTYLRASMLPAWPDCARRGAAKQWRKEITAAGYQLRSTAPSVGACVGTSVHAAAAHILRVKIETGRLGSFEDGLACAIDAFRTETGPGVVWDDTTANLTTAETQIRRMTMAYIEHVAPRIDPAAVEQARQIGVGDGFILTGHSDVIVTITDVIRDLKTGALMRPYQAQLGGYSLLERSQEPAVEVSGLVIDFVRRTPKTKPQDIPVSEYIDQEIAERTAYAVIRNIKSCSTEFRRRLGADDDAPEEAFLANPMSMMCRPQYCPAHGTDFCQLGREQ